LLILLIAELLLGSVKVSFLEAILNSNSLDHDILITSRLPRAILSILIGVSCALAGLGIQTIFKNPLAGPTTLGINSGASLGMALFFLIPGLSSDLTIIGAGGFAIIGAIGFLFLLIFTAGKSFNLSLILIVGLLLSYASYAVIEVLIQTSDDDGLRNYVFWGMGSLNSGGWYEILILVSYCVFGLVFMIKKSDWLNAYLLGEQELKLLRKGSIKKEKNIILIVLGVWVGIVTAVVGPIAFVGVIVPNVLKLYLKNSDMKTLITSSALLGASLLLIGDLLSRGAVFNFVLPLNSVLSILGVPIIIYLLLKKMYVANR
jgi:iron complex transport system permease protein